MSEKISRRSMLSTTGRAAVATLSLGGLAVAAPGRISAEEFIAAWKELAPEVRAFLRVLALRCDDESDAELRRLWAECQERDLVNDVAWEASRANRDDLERSLFDGETVEELRARRELSEAERQRWIDALDTRPRTLWEAANGLGDRLIETVKTIRATPAEGLFGIAVKLAALPSQWQGEDVEDSALAALGELNRKLLAFFIRDGLYNRADFLDASGQSVGNPEFGRDIFEGACINCHQLDGRRYLQGEHGDRSSLGWVVRNRPEQALHKILNGVPAAEMLSLRFLSQDQIADLISYLQALDPAEK